MDKKLVLKGIDLIKGATIKKDYSNSLLYDAMPWQMVNLKDKTPEWKEWNADYFEWIGLREVEQKHKRILKNRMMAVGILDTTDYQIGDTGQSYLNSLIAKDETPLKRFYPLIPPFINVLHGEFIKRDMRVFVTCRDREVQNDKLEYKMNMVNDILIQNALRKKQQALVELGITPVSEEQLAEMSPEAQQEAQQINQQYAQEMDAAKQIVQSEQKYKKYRHVMEQYGQLVLNRDRSRFNMQEVEGEAYLETIVNNEVIFHFDMLEDDYDVKWIDNARAFHHRTESNKYYSEGDYLGYFEFMSVGDIVNVLGRKLKEEHFNILQESVRNFADTDFSGVGLIPDQFRNQPGAYYDATKKYPKSLIDLNKYQHVQNEVIQDLVTNTSLSADQLSFMYKNINNMSNQTPKLFRVMRCYFRSQRKIGWLTKKNRAGVVEFQDWIDENFVVTEDPIYDNSLVKDKSIETLVYGEHIDWTWTNEWRHIIKININNDHPYWKQSVGANFKPIYIDGDPIKYNFSGKSGDPFDVHPPFEGVEYKMRGVRPVSLVETLSSFQIWANIAFNRVPDIMFDDIGLALAINKATVPVNSPGVEAGGDPLEVAMENLRVNKVFDYIVDREIVREQGNAAPLIPQILNLSRIQEGIQYMDLVARIKQDAGEVIGISRQRLAQSKASESATQTQAGIDFSETQTAYLTDRFINQFMPRVYQKMIEAAMYYSSISGTARAAYQSDTEGNAFLEVENMEGTFHEYNIECKSNAREKEVMAKLEQLFLNNNTTDTHMYDLALGVSESNPATILENLRKNKVKMEESQERQYQQELEKQKQAEEAARQRQLDLFEQEEKITQLNNESDERQVLLRGLTGMQTDADKDGNIDALENIRTQIQQTQMNLQNALAQNTLDFKKQQHQDNMSMQNKQLVSKQSIEHKKLAVAIANQNAKDDKELNRKIAKKQGVS